MSKEARIAQGKEGGLILIVEELSAKLSVAGSGPSLDDAAGWVLYHFQRHLDETRELFERMGLKPTPLSKLRPIPDYPHPEAKK